MSCGEEANVSETIVCSVISDNEVCCNGTLYEHVQLLKYNEGWFWGYLGIYIFLMLFAGLMSGLTIGLLSLDVLSLKVLQKGGKPRERVYAKQILRLVKNHHLLLVTLLLANAGAVEAMPIFLSKITYEYVAIIISVTAVLVFGEILPQALCTRFGLAIGYVCAPLVYLLMAMFFIVAFPIAKLLDCILGSEHTAYFRRAELRELVSMHATKEKENEEPLNYDEVLIIKGALAMRDKTVGDAMTPLESVFMLDINECIGHATMDKLLQFGHSRIPVYSGSTQSITGMLLVKKLIKLDPREQVPVKSLEGAKVPPPSCVKTTPLFDILNQFQTGRSHLYLVYEEDPHDEPRLVGIITLEDVIEELIGEEIIDETDVYIDVHRRISVARARVQLLRQQQSDPSSTLQIRRRRAKRSTSQPECIIRHQLAIPPELATIAASAPDESENVPVSINENETAPLLMNAEVEHEASSS